MSDIFMTSPDAGRRDKPLAGRRAVQSTSPIDRPDDTGNVQYF